MIGAVAAGAALGVVYTLSPMSVWFVVIGAAIVWAGRRGLPPREARWVAAMLAAALAVRAAAVAALFLFGSPDVQASFNVWFGDEQYNLTRALRQLSVWLGRPMRVESFVDVFEVYGRTSYVQLIALLQLIVGRAPYGVHLFNALLYAAAALILHRTVRAAFGRVPAFLALALVLFLPSLLLWSVTALKESFNFLIVMTLLSATIAAFRAPRRWRPAAALVAVAAIAALRPLRDAAFDIAVVGLGVALFGYLATRSARAFAIAVVVAAAAVLVAARSPRVQAEAMNGVRTAALTHRGHVYTRGHAYRLLDPEFYMIGAPPLRWPDVRRYVGRAVASVIVFPAPWQLRSRAELAYLPEQLMWYAVLATALVGFAAGLRRDPVATCVLAGYAVVALAVVALSTGNMGTLVRHRAFALPYLGALSAVGATALLSRFAGREREDA